MHAQSTATSPEITVINQTNPIEAPAIQQKADNTLKGRTVSWLNLSVLSQLAKGVACLGAEMLNTVIILTYVAGAFFLLSSMFIEPNLALTLTFAAASLFFLDIAKKEIKYSTGNYFNLALEHFKAIGSA